jgi:IS30 family transposase
MKYQQLTVSEREKIQEGLWAKKSLRSIAKDIGRPVSTVSREIKRNKPPERNLYTPRLAEERAKEKRKERGRHDRLKNKVIREYVIKKLKEGYSPEQIAGRLPIEHQEQEISYEAIYQYIYAQFHREGNGRCLTEDLRVYLKRGHRHRTAKGMRKGQRIFKPKGISIDERPKEIEERKIIGHWEGDSVVSRKSSYVLNTIVERKTGLVFITRLKDHTAKETSTAVIKRLGSLPPKFRMTLTLDNGTENSDYETITKAIGTTCYYAHPYHSWERGTNENTNGLIRWYLPKGTDFATISDEEIRAIETALNNRPRKRLGWKTPLEVFNESVAVTG